MKPFLKYICLLFAVAICVSISAEGQPIASRLDYPINTANDDFSPSVTADGRTMIFNSRSSKEGDHNIFISKFFNGRWSSPQPLEILNTIYNEETPFISADGSIILFSSDRPGFLTDDGTPPPQKDKFTYDIYISEKLNDSWTAPVKIPGEVNTDMNERSPALSIDKKTLFFTRYPYKYIKKSRIMKAAYDNGVFVAAVDLPPPVNSDSYDISMTPSLNGIGYYFSSIREGGMGGWDIYYIEYTDGRWGDINLLPAPVNSSEHDLFLSETYDKTFFCSNRIRGYGEYDIYSSVKTWNFSKKKGIPFIIDKPVVKKDIPPAAITDEKKSKSPAADMLKIDEQTKPIQSPLTQTDTPTSVILNVKNASDEKPVSLGFTIYLKDTDDSTVPELRKIIVKSDEKGIIKIYPKDDVKWLVVKHSANEFAPIRVAVKTIPNTKSETTLSLYPAASKAIEKTASVKSEKDLISLKPIYFPFNSSRIDLAYYPYLHKIINHMRENPSVKIVIEGHADIHGSERGNRQISIRRAMAVKKYLVKMKISKKRISLKGIGSAEADGNRRRYDQLDRKAEFTLINQK